VAANANAITVVKTPALGGTLSCPATVLTGGSANLTATTNPGYTFDSIVVSGGTLAGSFPTYTLSGVTAATTVTITWIAGTNTISYTGTPLAGGTVTGPASVLTGDTAAVTVTANTGYFVQSISATNGTISGTYPDYTLSGVTANTAVTVTFALGQPLTLTPVDYSITAAPGASVQFQVVVAHAVGTVSFQWYRVTAGKAQDILTGKTSDTLLIDPVTAADAGDYMCSGSDSVTSQDSPIMTLVVTTGMPVAGLAAMSMLAGALGLGSVSVLRRRKK